MLSISCYDDTDLERQCRDQLTRLLKEYDLERWLFTRDIVIRSFVIPRSHPTLTLNTRQLDDDEGFLGTFLHEQFHWFTATRRRQAEEAIEEYRKIYPTVPIGGAEGARSEWSNYLHLIICMLEFDALSHLIGLTRAKEVVSGRPYYRWVYRRVIEDGPQLRRLLERHRLALEHAIAKGSR